VIDIIGYVLVGFVAGGLASTLGIGGGVVYVPALVSLFAFSQHTAQGTSLAIIVPTMIVATIAHARAGRVIWPLMALIAAGGVLGAVAGARTALVLDEKLLKRIFAVVLFAIAMSMAWRCIRLLRGSRTPDGG